ncbi:hypothetical protein KAF25_009121 [Fusarium avenaceum]|uniref:Phosphoglycerate mutase n=1 Tax=Fusarium avenaceum TaxID=40199 RepID=A0A9P7GRP0_9HYPO|nr:hypothetical protein KAF25_009121 [Fusarium avenaceum]
MYASNWLPWLLAPAMMSDSTYSYQFSSEASWFTDYAEAARSCPQSKLITQPNLGLLDLVNKSGNGSLGESQGWDRFARYIQHLNGQGDPGVLYKVLLVVRHGRSVHNVVMDEVGSAEWKRHWSKLEGDKNRTWFDAELVGEGVDQAKSLGTFFTEGAKNMGFSVPDTVYTSPLARCLETTKFVFKDVMEGEGKAFKPRVKELLRERLTEHTCDRRRTSKWIMAAYPEYELETGFADKDVFWHANRSESNAEHVARTQRLLEDIWKEDSGTFIALITHSFALSSILEVIHAPHFRVGEGVMTAFLVKGQRLGID